MTPAKHPRFESAEAAGEGEPTAVFPVDAEYEERLKREAAGLHKERKEL